jgi:hypothetical protein
MKYVPAYRNANKPNQYTWGHLPSECKAHILSYLTIFEKVDLLKTQNDENREQGRWGHEGSGGSS